MINIDHIAWILTSKSFNKIEPSWQKINHKTCIKLIDLDELTGEVDSDGTGTIDLETFVEVVRVKQKQAEDEVEIKVVYTKKVGK